MVWTYVTNAANWAADNPEKSVPGFIALDVVINGGDMTIDFAQFWLSNDGVAELSQGNFDGAVVEGVKDGAEVIEETNDVLFNGFEKGAEGLEYVTGLAGDAEDGNIFKGIAIGIDNVFEGLKDGEEYLYNHITGNGWERSQDFEHIRNTLDGGNGGAETGFGNETGTPTETPADTGTGEPTETATQGPTDTATPGADTGIPETMGDINGYDVFGEEDYDALEAFFQETGEPDQMNLEFIQNEDGGFYQLEVVSDGETETFDLKQEGTYSGNSYDINGEEMQEIVMANEDGKLKDVFDEFYKEG